MTPCLLLIWIRLIIFHQSRENKKFLYQTIKTGARAREYEDVAIKEGNRLFVEFKGALSENFVLQSLVRQFESSPRYWTSGNKAEIDFLVQYENAIIPVEVKSDVSITGKSLTIYNKEFQPEIRIRYSLKNLKYDEGLLNIPLFMADFTKKLIGLAKKGKLETQD